MIAHHLNVNFVNCIESIRRLDRKNLISQDMVEGAMSIIASLLATQGGGQWWAHSGQLFTTYQSVEDFRSSSDIPLTDHLSFL